MNNHHYKTLKKRVMRLLLLATLFFGIHSGASAQNDKITLNVKDVTIRKFFDKIEEQSEYRFTYRDMSVDDEKRVTYSTSGETVESLLQKTLKPLGLQFQISGNDVVITRKTDVSESQDTKKYAGIITDETGEPVVGASIAVKGSQTGTVTTADGKFTLEAPVGSTLLVTYIGYTTQEIKLGENTNLQILMQEDLKLLDEVVVVGYGTQSKKTLTGSVSEISMANIESGTKPTITQALAGKAAGLRAFQQSAQPGGGVNLKIRGEGSLNAGNDPLIVVDGFPINAAGSLDFSIKQKQGSVDNMLDFLNPEDVESITVLKDAASTAIYGSRAGHGVILITTKKGKEQKAQVSYSGNVSVQQIRNNYQLLDTRSFMEMRNRQLYEEYLKVYALDIYADYLTSSATAPPFNPKYTNDQIYRIQGTDWLKEISRTGLMQQHNLS
ncbi:MAG: TonB-dependent receptor plug domain-containing protein, partial [Tannerella sp.]|nr:TonB-dependent receptor plug domain-containing protein [Tannerella sp.]